ncbi:hypothetical protein BKA63DRAFT_579066 [Paraphoma chrysanthemicola]|nr:hypothetical protein BKA63DRAFT_579066 [Paraphoma chrysanthemicola]
MDVAFMDPETAKLAVELRLSDIGDLLDGLYDDEDLPEGDARASFQILRYELQRHLQTLETQVLKLKILKEEQESRLAFSKLLEEEEKQAVSAHQLAMQLAGLSVTDPDIPADEQWNIAKELYAAAFEPEIDDRTPLNGIRTVKAGGARAVTKSKVLGPKVQTKCCACMEMVPNKDTLTLGCKPEAHTYCRCCLVDLFTSAIVNPTLFPPRCCKLPIPLDTCRAMLPKELIKDFDLKVEELATPNPTYCSDADCSKFNQLKDIKADMGSCVFCKTGHA